MNHNNQTNDNIDQGRRLVGIIYKHLGWSDVLDMKTDDRYLFDNEHFI